MMSAATGPAVEFERVTKAYGEVVAVREVSFAVDRGGLVTLLGPSGCGKTTMLRLIAGLERATAGRIVIAGKDVTPLPATERNVSMVFQSYALFPPMTVLENVSCGLRVGGSRSADAAARAEATLKQLGLAGFGARLPSELSGGQQQRVAVARALVLEPDVLLFDEPLSNLDAKLRRRVRDEIRELQQSLGITSVYVTHDQEEALAISDEIIVMNNAVIAQRGTPRQLYEEPADRFVADFIGDANLVPVEVAAVADGRARVRIGSLEAELPARGHGPGDGVLAIRPEALILAAEGEGRGLAATVRKAVYLGSHVEYTLDSEVGELFAIDPRTEPVAQPGGAVRIGLAGHGVTLVLRPV
jgi:iron(III) transport system ATP-binding protein